MELFDTHAHYDDERFDQEREEIITKIYDEGITKIINVGCNIETSKKSIEIAEKHEFIYASVGIHPSEIDCVKGRHGDLPLQVSALKEIETLSKHPKVVAIGEIGLDYHWNKENKDEQKKVFVAQIEIAKRNNLPIIIHSRDAIQDTIDIVKQNLGREWKPATTWCIPLLSIKRISCMRGAKTRLLHIVCRTGNI